MWASLLYPVGSLTPHTRFLKSPRDLQSLVTSGSLSLYSYSNAKLNLSSLTFIPPPQKKIHLFKTLMCADNFTEGLSCQREFISNNANKFKLSIKYLVLIYPWATLAIRPISLATFFSDFNLLPYFRPCFSPLSRTTFLDPVLPHPQIPVNSKAKQSYPFQLNYYSSKQG